MTAPQHLYAVQFSDDGFRDPAIWGGIAPHSRKVRYVLSGRQIEVVERAASAVNIRPFDHVENISPEAVMWDGISSLDGKTCLWRSNGGIGDALWHMAVIAEFKRRYPASRWYVAGYAGSTADVWMYNPNVAGMHPAIDPITYDTFKSFDYHFIPEMLTYALREKEQGNCYDILLAWAGLHGVPDRYKRPEVFIRAEEETMSFMELYAHVPWHTMDMSKVIFPRGYAVVQINTSKQSRNIPPELWFGIIRVLLQKNPHQPVIIIGEGDYCYEFAEKIRHETFNQYTVGNTYGYPLFFNLIDRKNPGGLPFIAYKTRKPGDLRIGEGCFQRNVQLSLRGLMPIVRNAGIAVACDSMMTHLCAANGIDVPCVSLFGPFDPAWRVKYYPKNINIYKPSACGVAPCAWHDDGFPPECPDAEARTHCAVMSAITMDDVSAAIEKITEE